MAQRTTPRLVRLRQERRKHAITSFPPGNTRLVSNENSRGVSLPKKLESATVFFRIDYQAIEGNDNFETTLRDTYVEIEDTTGMTEQQVMHEAQKRLKSFLATEFFGSGAETIIQSITNKNIIVGAEQKTSGQGKIVVTRKRGSTQTRYGRTYHEIQKQQQEQTTFTKQHTPKN
jgi:uncharacterized protein YbcI